MAKRMALAVQDAATQRLLVAKAQEEGWAHVTLAQPVDWPAVNEFLDGRPGRYFTFSCSTNFRDWHIDEFNYMTRTYQQQFYFSDKNTGFEFKMNFG